MMKHRSGPAVALAALLLVSPVHAQEASGTNPASDIERLTRQAEAEPDNSDAQVSLGLALIRAKRYDEARRALEKALTLAPNYHDARIGLARIDFFRGNLDAAEKELAEVRNRAPDNADAKALAEQVERARKAQVETQRPPSKTAEAEAAGRNSAKEAARLFRQGTQDYHAGRTARATRNLSRAAELDPDNSDIQVQLGSALLAQRRFTDARNAFRKALRLTPDYHDARAGLARVALARGAFTEADRELKELFARSPNNAEGRAVRTQLAQARAAAAPRADASRPRQAEAANAGEQPPTPAIPNERPRWRFDLGGSHSHLTQGNDPWHEGITRLAYRFDTGTTLSGGIEVSRRFGRIDTLFDARIDQQWSEIYTSSLRLGGTPAADFRPRFLAETGGTIRLSNSTGLIGTTLAVFDGGFADYVDANVGSVSPGIQQYFFNNRIWLTARFIGTLSETSLVGGQTVTERLGGYSVRADAQVLDRLSLFIGYANAPDTSEGRVFKAQTLFGGAELALDDSVSLRISAAQEDRENSYDRTSVNLGVAVRF